MRPRSSSRPTTTGSRWSVDGEVVTLRSPLRYRSRARALRRAGRVPIAGEAPTDPPAPTPTALTGQRQPVGRRVGQRGAAPAPRAAPRCPGPGRASTSTRPPTSARRPLIELRQPHALVGRGGVEPTPSSFTEHEHLVVVGLDEDDDVGGAAVLAAFARASPTAPASASVTRGSSSPGSSTTMTSARMPSIPLEAAGRRPQAGSAGRCAGRHAEQVVPELALLLAGQGGELRVARAALDDRQRLQDAVVERAGHLLTGAGRGDSGPRPPAAGRRRTRRSRRPAGRARRSR